MHTKSEELGVELSGYVLVDGNGKEYYWVNDWEGNTDESSNNPYYRPNGASNATFDNKIIKAQIHTHPSIYYTRKGVDPKLAYDGSSYKDYQFSRAINAPVYSIGPTSISMIYAPYSKYTTDADFKTLALGRYPVNNLIMPDSRINPFAISDVLSWLDNPFLFDK